MQRGSGSSVVEESVTPGHLGVPPMVRVVELVEFLGCRTISLLFCFWFPDFWFLFRYVCFWTDIFFAIFLLLPRLHRTISPFSLRIISLSWTKTL